MLLGRNIGVLLRPLRHAGSSCARWSAHAPYHNDGHHMHFITPAAPAAGLECHARPCRQAANDREAAANAREQELQRATDTLAEAQRRLSVDQQRLEHARAEVEAAREAAVRMSEDAARERKAAEAARRALAAVEAALDTREAQARDSWATLQEQAAALGAGSNADTAPMVSCVACGGVPQPET